MKSEKINQDADFPLEERIENLLAMMTLEEKIAQIYCHGRVPEMREDLYDAAGLLSEEKMAERFPNGVCQIGRPSQVNSPRASAELTNGIQRFLIEHTRLGIPALFNEEGLHGLMGLGATSFPQAIALASSWDLDLVERVFSVVALETRRRGSNYVYAPVLDLARDARWGRVEETFGEDPFLVSYMGIAAIRGLQGKELPIPSDKVIAIAKHYAVHGQPEGGSNSAPGNISQRIIREQFLPPFKAAIVEAGVQAVMAAYNEIDGVPVHINHWLLTEVLREEWGYEGFVTSDGYGVAQLMAIHHAAADPQQAARLAIEAGVDCEVPQGICFPSLLGQVERGEISEDIIDRSVKRILRAKFLLGLFDTPPYVNPDEAERVNNCLEHQQLALEAAHKSIVLLKNEQQVLPIDLSKFSKIAVIGPNAADLHLGGYSVDPGRGSSILEGIRERAGNNVEILYAEGCRITAGEQGWKSWHADSVVLSDPLEDDARITEAVRLASNSDLVILVLGGNEATCREGWWFNHLGDRDDLNLLGRQEELFTALVETGKPVIIVLINGRPLTIGPIADRAPAILECWYLGQETGLAAADVLFGDVNPSGKLPITFPRSVGQIPVYYYQKPSAKRGFLFASSEPIFPFGFGLSYTTFEYDNILLEPAKINTGERTKASVSVTNTGNRPGDEVVQLYIRDLVSTITRPVLELRGFQRIYLEPGETQRVTFEIGPDSLAGLDENMQPRVEPGAFEIMIGWNSRDHLSTLLEIADE